MFWKLPCQCRTSPHVFGARSLFGFGCYCRESMEAQFLQWICAISSRLKLHQMLRHSYDKASNKLPSGRGQRNFVDYPVCTLNDAPAIPDRHRYQIFFRVSTQKPSFAPVQVMSVVQTTCAKLCGPVMPAKRSCRNNRPQNEVANSLKKVVQNDKPLAFQGEP